MVLAAMAAAGIIVVSRLRPVHVGRPFSRRRRLPRPPTTSVQRKSGEELLDALRRSLPPGSDELGGGGCRQAGPACAELREHGDATEAKATAQGSKGAQTESGGEAGREARGHADAETGGQADPQGRAPPLAPAGTSIARCEIRLWRGFVKCQLYAVLEGSEERAVAFSKYFRLRDDQTSNPQGQQALAALLETLEARGWTVVLVGPSWYWHRLERFE